MGKESATRFRIALILVVVALALSGCNTLRPSRPVQTGTQSSAFIAPTLAPTLTPSPTVDRTTPTQIPDCSNVLSYLEDLSIPDGTHFEAGSKIEKQWQVKNSGTCNWTEAYTLQLVDGEAMGAQESQDLVQAKAGAEAVVEINFIAPTTPGEHKSSWQAFDPDGKPFGDKVFIQIVVNEP